MDLDNAIEMFCLDNASKYGGKASQGSVVGHIIAMFPETKSDMKNVARKIAETLAKINKLSPDEQNKIIEQKYPQLLEKKEKEERDIFAFLGIKDGDQIITAYPPGPEKYPHIGHAKASILNHMLAKRYKGKFILRFEDTNPGLVKSEFYDVIIDNLHWLGVEWDTLHYASDHLPLFYEFAEKIISSNDAYMCTCELELMRSNREKGIECACRSNSPDENMKAWRAFPTLKAGSAVLRLKIDLLHKNSTMRDPVIFRIIEEEHARQGNKYKVWPNYDFQNAIMDGHFKITHRLRSKEFEMRSELQRYIQKLLGLSITQTYEFARFNMEGVPSSGRIIREMFEKGQLIGWDDPTLATLVALRRRGFTPEAIKNFVVSTGMTKSESTMTWGDLIVQNKRVLDENADRYFFIKDPIKIKIAGAPNQLVEHHRHPQLRRGGRRFDVSDEFLITQADLDSLKEGELYRLMDCINFTKDKDGFKFHSLEYENFKGKGSRIMHYLPSKMQHVQVEVMMPDKSIAKGLGEQLMSGLKEGDIIQAERLGFMRLDRKAPDKLLFWFTHE